MSEARIATPYEPPTVRDLGRLSVLTAFDGGGLHFAQATLGSLPSGGQTPGGSNTQPAGSNVLGASAHSPSGTAVTPDASGVADTTASGGHPSSPAGAAGGGGGGGGELGATAGGGGGGGEQLPFTGMEVGPVAAMGAALATAGATLRRWARRA
jgi:hypothetical protein